jgi:DNA-binding IclR family transcriptional regulator
VVLRADAVLRSLRDKIDESVLLSKVSGLGATYLLVLESSHTLAFRARVGYPLRNLYATSIGKALLASLGEAELRAFLKNTTLKALTAKTNTSKTALRADLAEGNRRGWFVNREESEEGVTTLSARFMWISAVYVVTIAGPTTRMAGKLEDAANLLTQVCKLLEASPMSAD